MFDFVLRKPDVQRMYRDELIPVVQYQQRLALANDGLGRDVDGEAKVLKLYMSFEKHGPTRLENVEVR